MEAGIAEKTVHTFFYITYDTICIISNEVSCCVEFLQSINMILLGTELIPATEKQTVFKAEIVSLTETVKFIKFLVNSLINQTDTLCHDEDYATI